MISYRTATRKKRRNRRMSTPEKLCSYSTFIVATDSIQFKIDPILHITTAYSTFAPLSTTG